MRQRPTPTAALLYEFWPRQSLQIRLGLLAFASLMTIALVLHHYEVETNPDYVTWIDQFGAKADFKPSEDVHVSYAAFWALAALMALASTFRLGDSLAGWGVEERQLRLPISTLRLYAVPSLPALCMAAPVSFGISPLFGWIEEPAFSPWTFGITVLFLTAVLQTWMLVFANYSLALNLVGLAVVVGYFYVLRSQIREIEAFYTLWLSLFGLICTPMIIAAGIVVLDRYRHSLGTPDVSAPTLRKTHDFRRRRGPFKSAHEAQRWYEWRRTGWHLPIGMGIGATIAILLSILIYRATIPNDPAFRAYLETRGEDPYRTWMMFNHSFLWVLFVGPIFVRPRPRSVWQTTWLNFSKQEGTKISAMQLALPRDHHFFWRAERTAGWRNLAWGLTLWSGFVLYMLSLRSNSNAITQIEQIQTGTIPAAFALCLLFLSPMVVAFAAFLGSMSTALFLFPFLLMIGIVLDQLAYWGLPIAPGPTIVGIVVALIVLDAASLVLQASSARKLGVLKSGDIVRSVVILILAVLLLSVYVMEFHSAIPLFDWFGFFPIGVDPFVVAALLIATLGLMLAAAMVQGPIEFHKQRHQD